MSTCFERVGFSLYGRDWIGCVPGGTLISKGCREHALKSSLDEEKQNSTYFVSVALRALILLGSQPGASSAEPIRDRTVFQRRKKIFALIIEPT